MECNLGSRSVPKAVAVHAISKNQATWHVVCRKPEREVCAKSLTFHDRFAVLNV
jgi:hypothetical protein